jgi:hypothetical protein
MVMAKTIWFGLEFLMDKAMACSIPLPTPTVMTIPFGILVTSLSPLT